MEQIKVIQINCNGSRYASAMISEIANRREATLMLLSELNEMLLTGTTGWIVDTSRSACIVASHSTSIIGYGTEKGFAWIEIAELRNRYSCYTTRTAQATISQGFLDGITAKLKHRLKWFHWEISMSLRNHGDHRITRIGEVGPCETAATNSPS